ncbi:MAG: GlsB/YeaQ/YmgE family stress response membrane protein [Polyangiaceae bacterium]
MSLLLFILFGFIVGLVARALMPGRQAMGFIMTSVLGVVGSLAGGFIASALSDTEPTRLHPIGFIGSVLGALLVLGVASAVGGRGRALGT